MSFFAMMFLIWAFMRFSGMRRSRRGYAFGCQPHRHRHRLHYAPATPRYAPPAPPKETAYEALRRRYVQGDISDEQYEAHLDEMLKTPEGWREVNA